MYCTNCGKQIPDSARVCGFCGYQQGAQFQQPYQQSPYQQPPIQTPAPIIVQTTPSSGLFSGCGGLLNLVFSALVIGAIAFIVLAFLCVIRLPSEFPLINPPAPVADLWSRAVSWQGGSCMNRSQTSAGSPQGAQNQGENAGATACNRSKFVKETIPDHTVFEPGEKFSKTWTVRNDGTCTWTTAYTFRFTQGSQMGGAKSLNLSREVKPGDTYTFELDLTAPEQDGTYTGRWEIFDAQGNSFGWYSVVIDVGAQGLPEPVQPKEATVIVTPSNAPVGTIFSAAFSGYTPNSSIEITVKSLDSGWVYNDFNMTVNSEGKISANFGSAEFEPGQYVITGTGGGVTGSAVIIVEKNKCSEAKTQADCEAAGGQWAVIRMDPGPNQYYCNCP